MKLEGPLPRPASAVGLLISLSGYATGCSIVCYCCKECQLKDWREGGESKRLVEIRAMYTENAKREIEEQRVRWGVSSRRDGGGAGPSN